MLTDDLRSLLDAQPFRPFNVHVTDGSAINIHHHDYAWLMPSGFQLFIEDATGKVHIIETSQIAQITYDGSAPAPTHP